MYIPGRVGEAGVGGEGWKRGRARIWRTHRRETRAPLHAYTPKKKSKKKKKDS